MVSKFVWLYKQAGFAGERDEKKTKTEAEKRKTERKKKAESRKIYIYIYMRKREEINCSLPYLAEKGVYKTLKVLKKLLTAKRVRLSLGHQRQRKKAGIAHRLIFHFCKQDLQV